MTISQLASLQTQARLPEHVINPAPERYLGENYAVIDFETTNRDHGSALSDGNALILACGRLGSEHPLASRYPDGFSFWGDEFHQDELLQIVRSAGFIVGHNLKFEYQWLQRCGYDLHDAVGYDTMLGEYVIAGNRRFKLGLDESCSRYGYAGKRSFVSALIVGGVCPSAIPAASLEAYCTQDVECTEQLFLAQRRRLSELGLLPVLYQRCLVTPVLSDIERHGMRLDVEIVTEKFNEYSARYSRAIEEFTRIAGGRNPRSGKQMGEFLYGPTDKGNLGFARLVDRHRNVLLTPSGRDRTDAHTILALKADTDEQRAFKAVCTDLSKLKVPVQNLQKMKAVLDAGETLVHARFNQAVTQTHRLSSTGAGRGGFQFHNFDRAFKRCFRSREANFVVAEADAPQLEFRTAGILGHDERILESVRAGEDVHAFTASILGTSRQNAKAHTFKPLYGGYSGTPKEKAYYQAFREKYAATFEEQTRWTMIVAGSPSGELVTPWGLRFYWPGTKISRSGYVENTPSIFNYPIQSLATADIIPLCLVMIWHMMKDLNGFITNTIHDSVIAEIDREHLDRYKQIVVECFTKHIYTVLGRLYGLEFKMPLGVAIKSGVHWGEGQEELF